MTPSAMNNDDTNDDIGGKFLAFSPRFSFLLLFLVGSVRCR